jgi:hypothetical protein
MIRGRNRRESHVCEYWGKIHRTHSAAADDVCGTHADYGVGRIDTDSDPDADKP